MSDDSTLSEIRDLWRAELARQSQALPRASVLLAALGLCATALAKYSDAIAGGSGTPYFWLIGVLGLALLSLGYAIWNLFCALVPRNYSYPPTSKEILDYSSSLEAYYSDANEPNTLQADMADFLKSTYAESTDSLHLINSLRAAHLQRVVWAIGASFVFLFLALVPYGFVRARTPRQNFVRVEVIKMPANREEPKPPTPPTAPPKPEKPKPPKNRLIKEGGLGANKPPNDPPK